jgi:hypothetical protein
MDVVDWLLEGDPAIRWQAGRDLLNWPTELVRTQRARVATEGWGKQLLDLQDEAGTWANGLYSPKWTSTTYTLLQLYRFGLTRHPEATRAVEILLDGGMTENGGIDLSKTVGKPEICMTGMVLSLAATFLPGDDRIGAMIGYLIENQLDDGAWNCEATSPRTHGSLHSTMSTLEGLATARRGAEARDRAHAFLVDHRLYKSHRTGEVINPVFTRFSFPPRWHFDVLRCLDYLAQSGVDRDEGFSDAIALVHKKRQPDGTWLLQNTHPGRTFFVLEANGQPSRWNTLRALRVLRWWESD